ncbi:Aldo/keto reductase [Atractiella rhizophila]|nr:Aldo/keto reductase [Atractiella rhizophila]
MSYIDFYLLHWPQTHIKEGGYFACQPYKGGKNVIESHKEMEKLLGTGKVRSIGVSNFSPENLDILLKEITIVPAVNQVELQPFHPDYPMLEYCKSKGILVTAYCPIGNVITALRQLNADLTIKNIAERLDCTPGQVALTWGVKRRTSVVPKSVTPSRMKENLTLVDLTDQDMKAIDSIHMNVQNVRECLTGRMNHVVWNGKTVFGWTLEEMGWDVGFAKK